MHSGRKLVVACVIGLALGTGAFSASLARAAGNGNAQAVGVKKGNQDNIALVTYSNNAVAKITFLEDGLFRFNLDPQNEFSEYASPRNKSHVARIQAQPDTSDVYSKPAVSVNDTGETLEISAAKTTIKIDKATAKMSVLEDGKVVMAEETPITIKNGKTTQKIAKSQGEAFFGGGTQNGRFTHAGNKIKIVNTNNWVDGGVASPNPFMWSDKGYGILRNTFAEGEYDFGKSADNVAAYEHNDSEYDAYIFVANVSGSKNVARDLLAKYYKVTGNPVLLPEYAFYLGHLNAYNRDGWKDGAAGGSGGMVWRVKGGTPATQNGGEALTEYGRATGYRLNQNVSPESLNGEGPTVSAQNLSTKEFEKKFSARHVIDMYVNNDMPLGWFLPNDGYGCGYGQNGYYVTGGVNGSGESSPERIAAIDANVDNLRKFTEYANARGVHTGLWTQSNLMPDSNNNTFWHLLRDFGKEVNTGGISALKTDVAWVGPGYSFGLNGIKTAYNTLSSEAGKRPNIVTLDGWAGTQRYGAVWTGDQYGGNWEYIRFHIPTYIGQGLSGNPNVGSDMDGIFGGSPIISARDYQWKAFTPEMLDMDGWGSYRKSPMTHGDPYTGIARMYLKLKSQLMPYVYTTAASSANIDTGNDDTGLPMVRAMFLEDDSAYAASRATQYQYMFGKNFLVAPVYQNTAADGSGNDIRNNIFLPGDANTVWIDYFSGKQYAGGQVINGFDAPLWKLPLFVRAGAIVPMYEANNNPMPKSDTNPKGIDKTKRIVEFWPAGSTSYNLFEDNGLKMSNKVTDVEGYGKHEEISYGSHVSTKITSDVKDKTATLTINPSTGTYEGYDANRTTTFVVNVSAKPASLEAKTDDSSIEVHEVGSKVEFDSFAGDGAVWYFEQTPNLNTTPEDEGFAATKIEVTPKVYVRMPKTDVSAHKQTLVVNGFVNDGAISKDQLNEKLSAPEFNVSDSDLTPTSINLHWSEVADATEYELMVDGQLFNNGSKRDYLHQDLGYHTDHTYQVRSRNQDGYSAWSEAKTIITLLDPWRDVPRPQRTTYKGGYYNNQTEWIALDHSTDDAHFHSDGGALNKPLTLDYGVAYPLDKFEYYPRSDGGNGTVTKMKVETSLDGINWQSSTHTWQRSGEVKTVKFDDGTAARFVRLTPIESIGGFFSARELAVYKKDGSSGFAVGSNTMKTQVNEGDYTNMQNYLGLENREPLAPTFDAQIKQHYADLNNNDIYDVYDYAWTMSHLDGGTRKQGNPAGALMVVPSKTNVKAGDTIEVELWTADAQNINALGALINFNSDKFTYVGDSLNTRAVVAGMDNLSKAQTEFADKKQTINIAVANRGDKKLFAGSGVVASFKLKALQDGAVELPFTTFLIGPTNQVLSTSGTTGDIAQDVPESTVREYGQNAFKITMTNDVLTSDDGSNVRKLIQNETYNTLFDNVENYNNGNVFELKWNWEGNYVDGKLPEYVKVPSTIHFEFKNPSVLKDVEVVNRDGGNGTVKKIAATIYFEDGTTQEFSGGNYNTQKNRYVFEVSSDNARKKVTKVDITPQQTNDPTMLTLYETNFHYVDAPQIDSLTLTSQDATLYTDDMVEVGYTVAPNKAELKAVSVESDNDDVAAVISVPTSNGVKHFVRATGAGEATITVTSLIDETKSAIFKVTVKDGVDTSKLESALASGNKLAASAFTKESFDKLASALEAGQAVLTGQKTRSSVEDAVEKINQAVDGLVMRPLVKENLINKKAGDAKVVWVSSEITPELGEDGRASNLVDKNEDTIWHNNWTSNADNKVPQEVIFDLGKDVLLTDVCFIPRQDGGINGDILKMEVIAGPTMESVKNAELPEVTPPTIHHRVIRSLSTSSAAEEPKATYLGSFAFDNNGSSLTNRKENQATFGATPARFVKVRVLATGGGQTNKFSSASEFNFYGTVDADRTQLQALLEAEKTADRKSDTYTPETWEPYAAALKSAQDADANNLSDQAALDSAKENLEHAIAALELVQVEPEISATKQALQEAVAAEDQKALRAEAYTPESWKAYSEALAAAKNLLETEGITDEQYGQAKAALEAAVAGLSEAKGAAEEATTQTGSPSTSEAESQTDTTTTSEAGSQTENANKSDGSTQTETGVANAETQTEDTSTQDGSAQTDSNSQDGSTQTGDVTTGEAGVQTDIAKADASTQTGSDEQGANNSDKVDASVQTEAAKVVETAKSVVSKLVGTNDPTVVGAASVGILGSLSAGIGIAIKTLRKKFQSKR